VSCEHIFTHQQNMHTLCAPQTTAQRNTFEILELVLVLLAQGGLLLELLGQHVELLVLALQLGLHLQAQRQTLPRTARPGSSGICADSPVLIYATSYAQATNMLAPRAPARSTRSSLSARPIPPAAPTAWHSPHAACRAPTPRCCRCSRSYSTRSPP
jgi:hypothetical protein